MDFNKIALEEAGKSKCEKRKVGAVITDNTKTLVLAKGHNYTVGNEPCEDSEGETKPEVVHAEIAAISKLKNTTSGYIYVTHKPCDNCQEAIDKARLTTILVENFMKFDKDKLRYSLIPPIALQGLAEVLTFGAKKYKPNNWKLVDDNTRYIDALYRHLEAWRAGEELDKDSKLSHLKHAITNIAFLIYLEDKKLVPIIDIERR